MPPRPNVASVLKVRFIGSMQAGVTHWNNLIHLRYGGTAPTGAQLDVLASELAGLWSTNLASLCPIENVLTEVQITDLTSPTSASGLALQSVPGTRAGNTFTAQVAMVASWPVQLRFRGGHFRTYFPFGVVADRSTVITWLPVFTTEAATALNNFQAAISGIALAGGPLNMVGVSYFTNVPIAGTPRVPPLPLPFGRAIVHPRLDTQRRRLGKERPGTQ